MEADEDVLTALQREILKETGCTCDTVQELGSVSENRGSPDCNHCFIVNTDHVAANHLTVAERASRTEVQWRTLDEMTRLISEQELDHIQSKYLKMRDVMALQAYRAMAKIQGDGERWKP